MNYSDLVVKKKTPSTTGEAKAHSYVGNSIASGSIPNSAALSILGISDQESSFLQPDLVPGSGRSVQMPDALRARLEQHFGYSVRSLKLRESSDVDSLGAKAYAKGDEIHFAPGEFRPNTRQGAKMIAHEVAHIKQQAEGGVGIGGVELDPTLEHSADLAGDAVTSANSMADAGMTGGLPAMPTMSFATAPAQGWGISILNRKKKGVHEQLTGEALKKARTYLTGKGEQTGDIGDDDSFRYGARFNDVGHHSALGMAAQMTMLKRDAFINQTHHGDMQFLHSMDTSQGDVRANMAKVQRHAQFASDVFQNRMLADGRSFQDQSMLEYTLSQEDAGDPFQEMYMSTMVKPSVLKKFDKSFQGTRQERTQELKKLVSLEDNSAEAAEIRAEAVQKYNANGLRGFFRRLANRKGADAYAEDEVRKEMDRRRKNRSDYADASIRDFFTGGNTKLDAGQVALGSASHTLEDSFAGSHAIRSNNLFLGDQGKVSSDLTDNGDVIAEKATPVMAAADYNQQDNFILGGRHGHGDKFVGKRSDSLDSRIENTRGGALARDSAAQYISMNQQMKAEGLAYEGSDLQKFTRKVTRPDEFAADIPGGVTQTGAAYSKTGKGLTNRIGSLFSRSKSALMDYRMSTEAQSYNNRTTPADQAITMKTQLDHLSRVVLSTDNPNELKQVVQHCNEIAANLNSMIRQLNAQGQPIPSLLSDLLERAQGISRTAG